MPHFTSITYLYIMNKEAQLRKLLDDRILIIDGAMGTMIQRYKLQESDYRGERFKNWHTMLRAITICCASPSPIS